MIKIQQRFASFALRFRSLLRSAAAALPLRSPSGKGAARPKGSRQAAGLQALGFIPEAQAAVMQTHANSLKHNMLYNIKTNVTF